MTRPIIVGAHRPGVSQERFGEQAKQLGRNHVLDGEATIHRYQAGQDAGGAPDDEWVPDDDPVPAHLEPASTGEGRDPRTVADQTAEFAPHLIYLDPEDGESVVEQDRIEMMGNMYQIMGIATWNLPETIVFQVKEKTA